MGCFDKNEIYVIAEMSANHNGSLDKALELVHIAKECGADCLKLQTYTADSMTIDCDNDYFRIKHGLWNGYRLYDLYRKAATPYEWHAIIKEECSILGIDFISTPFDKRGVDFLDRIGVETYKIASFENVDIPLIKYIAQKKKNIILSCGMATLEEIEEAYKTMIDEGMCSEQIALLRCISSYPAKEEEMNLNTIVDMRERFGVSVGISDHTVNCWSSIVAVSLGATIVEKHLCLSRKESGVDSAFSLEPSEFREMVDKLKIVSTIKGKVQYGPTKSEEQSMVFRRSIFAVKNINPGELFNENNVRVIRPGFGLKPKYYNELLGKTCTAYIKCGEPIQMNHWR